MPGSDVRDLDVELGRTGERPRHRLSGWRKHLTGGAKAGWPSKGNANYWHERIGALCEGKGHYDAEHGDRRARWRPKPRRRSTPCRPSVEGHPGVAAVHRRRRHRDSPPRSPVRSGAAGERRTQGQRRGDLDRSDQWRRSAGSERRSVFRSGVHGQKRDGRVDPRAHLRHPPRHRNHLDHQSGPRRRFGGGALRQCLAHHQLLPWERQRRKWRFWQRRWSRGNGGNGLTDSSLAGLFGAA